MGSIILQTIILLSLTACLPKQSTLKVNETRVIKAPNSGVISDNQSPGTGTVNNYFEKSYASMQTCFKCHTSGYAYGDFEKLKSEDDWIKAGLVEPGRPDESLLIKKLKHSKSTIATMPPVDADFTYTQFLGLRTWITHILIPQPLPSAGQDQFKVKPQVIGIEQFLDQLKKFYFIKGTDNAAFNYLSNNWRPFWGGGCDFYKSAINGLKSSYQLIFNNPTHVCDYPTNHDGPTGFFNVIKAGSRINICEYFADSDYHLDEFFRKNIITGTSFNKSNAEKVFLIYYPTLNFTDEVYNNFIASAKAAYPTIESNSRLMWRFFHSTLCQSLLWEVY